MDWVENFFAFLAVWPDKNRQMSVKVAQNTILLEKW